MEDSVVISKPVNADTAATVPSKMGSVKGLKRSARRCLFGRPDPQNVDQWLTKELNEIRREQQLRWGFLFSPENPSASAITSEWEFTAVPAESVCVWFCCILICRSFNMTPSTKIHLFNWFNMCSLLIKLSGSVRISLKNVYTRRIKYLLRITIFYYYTFVIGSAVLSQFLLFVQSKHTMWNWELHALQ